MNPAFPHRSDSGNDSDNDLCDLRDGHRNGYGFPEVNGYASANGAGRVTSPAETALMETEPEAIIHLRAAVRAGVPWPQALLEAVALWTAPREVHRERTYRYLIQGEALDWLTLSERLGAELAEMAPEATVEHFPHAPPDPAHGEPVKPSRSVPTAEELERLLFQGRLPAEVTPEEFKDWMGSNKYRAYLNYWYGVVVEEALQQAVEDDVRKRRLALCYPDHEDLVEEAFTHLYGQTRCALLKEYRQEAGIPQRTALTLADGKEFTYWLSKRRFKLWDPARIASDTRKGIRKLKQLEQAPGPLAAEAEAALTV